MAGNEWKIKTEIYDNNNTKTTTMTRTSIIKNPENQNENLEVTQTKRVTQTPGEDIKVDYYEKKKGEGFVLWGGTEESETLVYSQKGTEVLVNEDSLIYGKNTQVKVATETSNVQKGKEKDETPKTPSSSTTSLSTSAFDNVTNDSGTHKLNEEYKKGELSSSLSTIPKDYQNPDDSALAYSYENNKSRQVWITMRAIAVKKLSNNVRAQQAFSEEEKEQGQQTGLAIKLGGKDMEYSFKFLVPEELIETITHSWEPYESLASQLQQLYTQYLVALPEQIQGMASALGVKGKDVIESAGLIKDAAGQFVSNVQSKGLNLKDVASKVVTGLKGMTKTGFVANFRPDSPLQYKNSERRIFTLVFNLISINPSKNNETVVLPVKLLEMLSSPSYEEQPDEGTNTEIILPYVFSVNTTPGNLITCDMAVLKEVQPTWRGPWHNGYPARCELRLNFQEYRPLEQKVFYGTSEQIIKTVQRQRADAFKTSQNAEKGKSASEGTSAKSDTSAPVYDSTRHGATNETESPMG